MDKFTFEFTQKEAQTILDAITSSVVWNVANPLVQNIISSVQRQTNENKKLKDTEVPDKVQEPEVSN